MLESLPFPIEEVQTDHGTEFIYIFMPLVNKPHPFEVLLKVQKQLLRPPDQDC